MITTAVFPVAGKGDGFGPATHVVARDLLPVLDTPVLDFAIGEARDAGVQRFVFVTREATPEIEAYVTARFPDLAAEFLTQEDRLGLGHAVLTARRAVPDGPFGVIVPGDVIFAAPSVLAQMTRAFDRDLVHHMTAAMEVPEDRAGGRNRLVARTPAPGRTARADRVAAPSAVPDAGARLATVGRHILSPTIFETLMTTAPGRDGDLRLSDALTREAQHRSVLAFRFQGVCFDCATPEGLLEAGSALQDARDMTRPGAVA